MPNSVFIETDELGQMDVINAKLKELSFPVIVKPRISSIQANAHKLIIVKDKNTLIDKIFNEKHPDFEYLKHDTIII